MGEETTQIHAQLVAAGCTANYFDEQISIRGARPQLEYALAAIPPGGALVVCRLIHIGQSLEDLVGLLDQLSCRGVQFRSLHEQLDTAEHGELLLQVTHGLIDARRTWQSKATRDGLAAAIAAGRKPGRQPGPPPLTPEQHELAHELKGAGLPITDIADLLGVSRAKLYRTPPPGTASTNGEDSAP
ncbi:recombinase family protein [Salinispora sp. H7-4]|nr:recombinase family protein [Salinispora sp. H7-4]